jgi:hypothetical protein
MAKELPEVIRVEVHVGKVFRNLRLVKTGSNDTLFRIAFPDTRNPGSRSEQPRDTLVPPATTPPVPDKAAYLLRFLPTDREKRETIIGDLEEEFQIVRSEHGLRRARLWFWWMSLASFWPFLRAKIPGLWSFVKRWVIR